MKSLKLSTLLLLLSVLSQVYTSPSVLAKDITDSMDDSDGLTREERIFFGIIRVDADSCDSSNGNVGTCLPAASCTSRGGTASGSCANGYGVCCVVQKTCAGSTSINGTYFINPNYPDADTGNNACILTINRLNSNICQMRFDLVDVELSQPNEEGFCIIDFLTVTGGISTIPTICGTNSGQHLYVDVQPNGGAVLLTVDRSFGASTSNRRWNINVTQIDCGSSYKAPIGCLQYFTETSGTVNSFNFAQTINDTIEPPTTREIVNQHYGVCIQQADGYCSIIWSRNTTGGDFGFSMTDPVEAVGELIGQPVTSTTGPDCITDFVVIPGGVDDEGIKADRFCGLGFPSSVTTILKPFVLYVNHDENEDQDAYNRGFSLDYRQTLC